MRLRWHKVFRVSNLIQLLKKKKKSGYGLRVCYANMKYVPSGLRAEKTHPELQDPI